MSTTTIKNEGGLTGGKHNADGSPVQELDRDGQKVGEIHNKERTETRTERNADGSPVKEVRE